MPSASDTLGRTPHSEQRSRSSVAPSIGKRRVPRYVLVGIALLIVALALFLYAYNYRPTQLHPTYKAQIDNPPAATEAPDRSMEPKVRIGVERHHSLISESLKLRQHVPAQVATAAMSPSPTFATTRDEDKKPNVFRRILDFFKRLFGGRRHRPPTNEAPVLHAVTASSSLLVRECAAGTISTSCQPSEKQTVGLVASVSDVENDQLVFDWSVTGGRIIGKGTSVDWDLSGVANGTYTANVTVSDGGSKKVEGSTSVVVTECTNCKNNIACPTVTVEAPDTVSEGNPIEFT